MSLRGIFSRNTESHRRRKNAPASSALSAHAEFLEERTLLSVVSPLLTDHGANFGNGNVLGRTDVTFFPVNNPLYSGNSNGLGLNVVLDGAAIDGNLVSQLRTVTLQDLVVTGNGNAGVDITLSNLDLDELRIDGSQITGNGRAGLVINLNNVQIDRITIVNSDFSGNANDGLCVMGNNSIIQLLTIGSVAQGGNNLSNSAANTGGLVQLQNSRVGTASIVNNQINGNATSGIDVELSNTNISNLDLNQNSADNNKNSAAFFNFLDSDVGGTVTNNTFTNSQTGDGLNVTTRRSVLPNGQISSGLRNLDLEQIRGNTFTGNALNGINIDLGENTTFSSQMAANTISTNGQTGINIQAADTRDAFDVLIGGDAFSPQGVFTDANMIDGNSGAGIAITLDDTSDELGNTSGRFRIYNNQITNTLNDNNPVTEFAGEGIFVRARGTDSLVNGAARILNSQIDGNMISGNTSDGIKLDVSEDSEVVDLLIGDVFNPNPQNNTTEGPEGDGYFFQGQYFRNSGNIITNNLGDGINFLRRGEARARGVKIIDNLFQANANGIQYQVQNDDKDQETGEVLVNSVLIQHNDSIDNALSGIELDTVFDALLIADLDNNTVTNNTGDGIATSGFESDPTDRETLGGTWTRNTVANNGGIGISINGVPGTLNPLKIGEDGTDSAGRSLGNLIDLNGNDGIEINAPGTIDITNNIIRRNGTANTANDPQGDGKGIDINVDDVGILNVFLGRNVITKNKGDGLEMMSRDTFQFQTGINMLAYGNIIDNNLGRGVDLLNQGDQSSSYIVFGDGTRGDGTNANNIVNNGLEGFLVVNTTSPTQTQDVNLNTDFDNQPENLNADGDPTWDPDLVLDVNGNEIRSNGNLANQSLIPPIVNGSGLVMFVGTSETNGVFYDTVPDRDGVDTNLFQGGNVGENNSATGFFTPDGVINEGNGRVNARVNNNLFGGNAGVDVLTQSFTSTVDPSTTAGTWDATKFQVTPSSSYRRDPLARLNLEFTNNTGDAVDLVRTGAFYNNAEGTFKSRTFPRTAPDPNGPFSSATRRRNAQRVADRDGVFDEYQAPRFGSGGLFAGFGSASGTIIGAASGTATEPIRLRAAGTIRTGDITGATNATPIVITSANHGLNSGDIIDITGVNGNTNANGTFQIIVLTPNTFELYDVNTGLPIAGNANYTNGGTWTQSVGGHGLQTGDNVLISNMGIDGIYTVTVINADEFYLNDTYNQTVSNFNGFFDQVRGDFFFSGPFLYDGTGASTFRMYEANNSFSQGSDIGTAVGYPGNNLIGEEPFAYDPVSQGVFNFRTIRVLDTTVTEGNQAAFTVQLSQPLDTNLRVFYKTEFDGTANDGREGTGNADFTPVDFTGDPFTGLGDPSVDSFIDIPAGQTTGTILIDTLSDTTFESPETFKVVIVQATTDVSRVSTFDGTPFTETINIATAVDQYGTGTILDNDTIPQISIDDTGGFELGNGGIGTMTFTVTLSNPSTDPVFVDFRTANDTAAVGVDYRLREGTVTFSPGETSKTITVEILPDTQFTTPGTDLDQETLFINLSAAQGATILDAQGVGTIFDARFVNISDAYVNGEGDAPDTVTAEFTVSLTDSHGDPSQVPLGQTLTVNFNTQDVTAIAASGDYIPFTNGTLVFNQFESTKTISVVVNQDRIFEGDETFNVNLTSNNGTIEDATGVGHILESLEVASTRDEKGRPTVKIFDARSNNTRFTINPYPGFNGEARVATADFNADGIADIVTTPGPGGGPDVRVFDGRDGSLMREYYLYEGGFFGGLFVATGDINNDGQDDIIVSPDTGGGPRVIVVDGATGTTIEDFFAYDPGFFGGVRIAAGDVDGTPGDEVITGAGPTGGPHVQVFHVDGDPMTAPTVIRSFFAYDRSFTGGIYVSAADVGGGGGGAVKNAPDGHADIITGAGFGGGPHVRIFDGATGTTGVTPIPVSILGQFMAYSPSFTGGVRVATGDVANDVNGDTSRNRIPEIITAPGLGGGPDVKVFAVNTTASTMLNPVPVVQFREQFPFPGNLFNGTYIAGRNKGFAGEGSPLSLDPSILPQTGDVPVLTQEQLAPVVDAAINRLAADGVDEAALDQLRQIQFLVTDLAGAQLGFQTPGRIFIDRTAAGQGYFVDPTPLQDEEFSNGGDELLASSLASLGRVDLLTVVLHELEHTLGKDHVAAPHNLMAPTIGTGERRLPEEDSVFADGGLFDSLMNLS